MAAIVPFIPYIVAAGGTLLQGSSAKGSAQSEALQLEQQAGQDRASSQRAAIEQRRSARYMQSRVQALAAGSGAGASDPTVINLEDSIDAEGEYAALTAMYEGEDVARGKEYGATVARKQGKAAQSASYLKAAGTLLSGASSWYDKYGGGGPSGTDRLMGRAARSAFSFGGSVRGSVKQGTSVADSPLNSARYA